jgi:hypothetical protein
LPTQEAVASTLPYAVGSHFPGVQHAVGTSTMPTMADMARSLGINLSQAGVVLDREKGEFSFTSPGPAGLTIQLPVSILLENGDSVRVACAKDLFNYSASKFDPLTGCTCIAGKDKGTAGKLCFTCASKPTTKVQNASRPESEWPSLQDAGYCGDKRGVSIELALALLLRPETGLPPHWAPGRPSISEYFGGCEPPKGAKGNKVEVPTQGNVRYRMFFHCMYPGSQASTDGGTHICGAVLALEARQDAPDKLFVVFSGSIPHRHALPLCFEHGDAACRSCSVPPPMPPFAGCDGLHGAACLEALRNELAVTHGRQEDQPRALSSQALVSAQAMWLLLQNTQRFPSERMVETLLVKTNSRRFRRMGLEPDAPGETIRATSKRWADDVVRTRRCRVPVRDVWLRTPVTANLTHSLHLTRHSRLPAISSGWLPTAWRTRRRRRRGALSC